MIRNPRKEGFIGSRLGLGLRHKDLRLRLEPLWLKGPSTDKPSPKQQFKHQQTRTNAHTRFVRVCIHIYIYTIRSVKLNMYIYIYMYNILTCLNVLHTRMHPATHTHTHTRTPSGLRFTMILQKGVPLRHAWEQSKHKRWGLALRRVSPSGSYYSTTLNPKTLT